MSYEIEIAVFADWLPEWEPPIGGQGHDLPYADRLKLKLLVEDEESLQSVYRRAVDAFQPRVTPAFAAYVTDPMRTVSWTWFYEPSDDQNLRGKRYEMAPALAGVGTDGLVRWGRSQAEIPYGDLVRSGRDGLLRGDPLRPYLVLLSPQGGGGSDLQAAWDAVQVCWTVLAGLGTTAATARLLAKVARRVRGASTLKDHQDALVERGAGPRQIAGLVEARPWQLADLRIRMGLDSDEEARSVLELYGCKQAEEGWRFTDADDEVRFMRWAEDEVFSVMRRGDQVTVDVIERLLSEAFSSRSFPTEAENEPDRSGTPPGVP